MKEQIKRLMKKKTPTLRELVKLGFEEIEETETDTRYGILQYENFKVLYDRQDDCIVGYRAKK